MGNTQDKHWKHLGHTWAPKKNLGNTEKHLGKKRKHLITWKHPGTIKIREKLGKKQLVSFFVWVQADTVKHHDVAIAKAAKCKGKQTRSNILTALSTTTPWEMTRGKLGEHLRKPLGTVGKTMKPFRETLGKLGTHHGNP